MTNNYFCPICKSNINIGNSLVFSAKSPENEKGLLFLDTELGNYTKRTHADFQLKEGVEYKFYCPVCHSKLNKEDNTNLVLVHMTDGSGKDLEIYISNIIGEHCTYKIQDRTVEAIGPHASRYEKYLDVPMEYRKYL
jgi:C4-type Zn-finger protein